MKEIKLTQNRTVLIDDENYDYISQFKWHPRQCARTCYAIRHVRINGHRTTIAMHQELLNTPCNMMSDHIDGNGLNNQKKNLRICSIHQNAFNRKVPLTSRSGYKGVCWHKLAKKWIAQIKHNYRMRHLGYHSSRELAAMAYNNAAVELFGEFARLNDVSL
ncbi:MAG: AP2 domain-containing protein [Methanolobus sp.]|uniref:AP2 domain-containing protein n=1 Tax=Methanolobus sp. TaxID=1874737 RepID=UPI00272F2761|nr:AP2 domain-containing protein [Methanolobus sp.]MDP2218517.1 AP2 domain-containing protein [Methanolobus sp.]